MHAFVESLSGLVRAGPACRTYGDPWEFICGYSSVDGKTAVLKGLRVNAPGFSKAHVEAALDALAVAGFQFASWDRHKIGGVRHITRDLRKRLDTSQRRA
jgi:hypothetical protein